jgi:hypothetical protein
MSIPIEPNSGETENNEDQQRRQNQQGADSLSPFSHRVAAPSERI